MLVEVCMFFICTDSLSRVMVKLSVVNGVNDLVDGAGSALMPVVDMICELCMHVLRVGGRLCYSRW